MRRSSFLALATLIVVLISTAVVYLPTLRSAFVFDDQGYVVNNPQVRHGFSADSVRWAFTTFCQGNWHPLTWLSHMADVHFFNMDAGEHHLFNILLHLVNTLLLFVVLHRMTGAPWRSVLVSGLFALHPLRVESVAWVAERKDLLCAFFWFLGLFAWLSYLKRPAPGRYLLVVLLFVLGLMSKPMIMTFPFLLLLLDVWPLGRLGRGSALFKLLREKIPFFVLTFGAVFVFVLAQKSAGAVGSLRDYPAGARFATAVTAFTAYLSKTGWPANLAVSYPYRGESLPWSEVALSALVLAAVTAVVWWQRRRGYPVAGWCWYLGTLVPVIGIVQVGDQAFADRYTYVPLVGVFVLVVWGAEDLLRAARLRREGAVALALAALAVLAVLSSRQVRFWKDEISLFGHAAAVVPGNWLAYSDLGFALAREFRYQEALPFYEKALSIYPDHYETLTNLGNLLSAIGRNQEAISTLEKAISVHPERYPAYVYLGYVYMGRRDKMSAMGVYRRLFAVNPDQAAQLLDFVRAVP